MERMGGLVIHLGQGPFEKPGCAREREVVKHTWRQV